MTAIFNGDTLSAHSRDLDWRLAIDQRYRRKGYGRFLLAYALFRAVRSEIASVAVIVHAKDDDARRFYERESFLPFPDQPVRLFRPMADIAALYVATKGSAFDGAARSQE